MTGEAAVVKNFWDQIKSKLAELINDRGYSDWVTHTAFESLDKSVLHISVPDLVSKQWMEQEYAEHVRQVILELHLPVERVIYTPGPERTTPRPIPLSEGGEPVFAAPTSQLNQRFRFDNYVVGSCNQFATLRRVPWPIVHPAATTLCSFTAASGWARLI